MIFGTFSALKHSLCGAITTQPLELACFEGADECSICGIVMPLPAKVLDTLRRQAVEAQGQMDELVRQAIAVATPAYLRGLARACGTRFSAKNCTDLVAIQGRDPARRAAASNARNPG